MFRNVCASMYEALDITMHLRPLVPHIKVSMTSQGQTIWFFSRTENKLFLFIILFKALEAAEFAELRPLFSPLMHTVCLIYSNSKHYNSPSRLIVLMKEVCNLLIGMARKHIDPATLFQIEVACGKQKCKCPNLSWRASDLQILVPTPYNYL